MKKLLFYYPSNKRSNPMETLMVSLKEKGLDVLLLTTCEKGDLHLALEQRGVKSYANPLAPSNSSLKYYWKQIQFLIRFCKEQQIDVVHSHLQHVNFIAVFAQFFLKAKVVLFRHHGNFIPKELEHTIIINKKEKVFDWFIQTLGKRIIVPSSGVFDIVKSEKNWDLSKFSIIPYIYDFDSFPKPDNEKVAQIKEQYPAAFRLLSCSRLIPLKRPLLTIQLTEALIAKGFNVKLFVLDAGYLEKSLKEYVLNKKLEQHIVFLGYKTDFINYFSAIDILVHPSLTEASSSTVKELGLLRKAVVVCEGVGDFDDYIKSGVNGIKVPKSDSETHFLVEVEKLLTEEKLRLELGNNLHDTVISNFDKSEKVIQMYLKEC